MSDSESKFFEQLFGAMEPVRVPDELASEDFLEGIYDRAVGADASEIAHVLQTALPPLSAPLDATWVEPEDLQNGPQLVEAALPAAPTAVPGVLWTRIQADLRNHVAAERHRARFSARSILRIAIAAAILIGALVGTLHYGSSFHGDSGTSAPPNFVFQSDPSLSFDDRLLGR